MEEQEQLWLVKVLRKKESRERKHRVLGFIVMAKSEDIARAMMIGTPFQTVVAVQPLQTTVIFWADQESLTDADVVLFEAEGYAAVRAKQQAEHDAKIAEAERQLVEQEVARS